MKLIQKVLVSIFLLLFCQILYAQATPLDKYLGKVIYVVDGDTLYVKDNWGNKHKIRIANIDAPEMKQAGGKNSRSSLLPLSKQQVTVLVISTDRYHREVAEIYWQGQDIGLKQIMTGQAWFYRHYAKINLSAERFNNYHLAEHKARQMHLGLWRAQAIPPWLYRRQLMH